MNNYHSGHRAEFLARLLFRLKGYRILAANYVSGRGTHAGEVDFVAKRGNVLVFVEVKNEQRWIKPLMPSAIYRNGESAPVPNLFEKHPQFNGCDIRFDAVLVKFPCSFRHLENAW